MALGRLFINKSEYIAEDEIYGIEQLACGGQYGSWQTVDGNGNIISLANNTTKKFPWRSFQTMTSDNISGVYIPKIYVKNEVEIENGTGYNLIKRYIANKKFEGFHCHPAFMENGIERDGVLIGNTYAKSVSNDWHFFNFYEYSLLLLLALIEYGTSDIPNNVGGDSAGFTSWFYGIGNAFFSPMNISIAGIDTSGSGGSLRIFDNQGNKTFVDTGIKLPKPDSYNNPRLIQQSDGTYNGYSLNNSTFAWDVPNAMLPVDFQSVSGTNFDLNDIFLAKTLTATGTQATCLSKFIPNDNYTNFKVVESYGKFGLYCDTGTNRNYRLGRVHTIDR